MQVVDKVHITLTPKDIEKLVKEHFNKEGITVSNIRFDVKPKSEEDSMYSSYQLHEVTCEGARFPIPPKTRGGIELG